LVFIFGMTLLRPAPLPGGVAGSMILANALPEPERLLLPEGHEPPGEP
jgi:hypothetical protein